MEKIAIQCPSCKLWFDNTLSNCPYCNFSKAEVSEEPEEAQSQKKPGLFGAIGGISLRPKSGKPKPKDEDGGKTPENIDPIPPTDYEDVPAGAIPADSINSQPVKPETENVEEVVHEETTPPAQEKARPQSAEETLGQQIGRVKKTVGRYIDDSGETISPVVGWLVGVKGKCFGQSFPIRDGKNKIGRSAGMEISLLNDDSVSRSCEATIIYDSRSNAFHIIPGESASLGYVNNEPLYERVKLKGMEEIEFGDSGKNKYVFVPLCGENFQWSAYST